MIFEFILFVFIGGLIGYITNYLAIKMLFRPYKKVYLFNKIPIPFTPGVIPKEKEIIAEAIADTLEKYVLTEDKFQEILEKSNYKEKLKGRIEIVIGEVIDKLIEDLKRSMFENISIGKFNFKSTFILNTVEKATSKALDKLKSKLKEKLIKTASETIEKSIDKDLKNIISEIKIKEAVKETLLNLDIEDLEFIILGITDKQLKHITYLGAILGALIGVFQFILNVLIFSN